MTQKKKKARSRKSRKTACANGQRPPYGRINESVWDIKRRYCKGSRIDSDTLAKHYRAELDTALIKANSKAVSNYSEKAMTGDPPV